jgi:hypothetical protein
MSEDDRLDELAMTLPNLVADAKTWKVYWYDSKEWDTLRLTDPATYAEHLYNCDIDCILVPENCYNDPEWYEKIKEMITEGICILPGKSLNEV